MSVQTKFQVTEQCDLTVEKDTRSYGGPAAQNALKVDGASGRVTLPLTLLQDSWDKVAADGSAAATLAEHVFFRAPASVVIKAVRYVPDASLTAADATKATLTVAQRSAAGASTNASFAVVNTATTGGGGSGNWTAFVAVPLTLAGSALAAGDLLTIAISKLSTGTVVPAGSLEIDFVLA